MIDLPPPNPGIELSIASRGISKGIAQTDGPQFVGKGFVLFGDVQIGAQWKNVTSPVAEGEGALFATAQHKFGRVQASLGATLKFQTDVREPTDDKALELNGSATAKWGKVGARVSAVFSPDDLGGSGRSLYVEAGPSYDVSSSLRFSAAVGRRERAGSPDYTSFNAGLSKSIGKLTFDLRYYDTAQSSLGKNYRGRAVASARLSW